jgi:hypothetical protein
MHVNYTLFYMNFKVGNQTLNHVYYLQYMAIAGDMNSYHKA